MGRVAHHQDPNTPANMDYSPSNDYHQGRRHQAGVVDIEQATADIQHELTGMDLLVRGLEDGVKRLNAADMEAFSIAQHEQYERLRARLFDLTK